MYWLKDPTMISFFIFLFTTIGYIIAELLNAKRKTRMPLACIAILCCLGGPGMMYQDIIKTNRASTLEFVDTAINRLESNNTDKVITSLKRLKKQLAEDHFGNISTFMNKAIKDLTPEHPAPKSDKNKITSCILDSKKCYDSFNAQSYWHPNIDAIKKAKPIIIDYIKQKNLRIYRERSKYRCQYIGIIQNGKKVLYCNFFLFTYESAPFMKDWENNPVIVNDGGNSFFQIEYDAESKKCISFSVNGEA